MPTKGRPIQVSSGIGSNGFLLFLAAGYAAVVIGAAILILSR